MGTGGVSDGAHSSAARTQADAVSPDPDEALTVPLREASAALALLRGLVDLMDHRADLAETLVEYLNPAANNALSQLPEVGPVKDTEGLRLHFHRLHDRLAFLQPASVVALPPPPVTVPTDPAFPTRRASRSAAVVADDLADYFVWWDDITAEDSERYAAVLSTALDERPLQRHLALHPLLLAQHLGGGHGRWVIPQKRLGSEYVTDFVIGERSSSGFEWQFVELQSPRARLFVRSGRQSQQFDEGLRQVREWRRWLTANIDYARRPRSAHGLGLADVSPNDPGLLIIGREVDLTEDDRQRRRQLDQESNVRIRTYDWLVREANARVRGLGRQAD